VEKIGYNEPLSSFRNRAIRIVRNGYQSDPLVMSRVLGLCFENPFSVYSNLEIFAQDSKYVGSHVKWRSDLDHPKFYNPVERLKYPPHLAPTIEWERVDLDNKYVEDALSKLRSASPPVQQRWFIGHPDHYEISVFGDTLLEYCWTGGNEQFTAKTPPHEIIDYAVIYLTTSNDGVQPENIYRKYEQYP
jgi:hypothetical protein